jgi:hypothetical protein
MASMADTNRPRTASTRNCCIIESEPLISPLNRTAHINSSEWSGTVSAADEEEVAADEEEVAADADEDADATAEADAVLLACAEQNCAALKSRLIARDIRRHDSRSSGLARKNGGNLTRRYISNVIPIVSCQWTHGAEYVHFCTTQSEKIVDKYGFWNAIAGIQMQVRQYKQKLVQRRNVSGEWDDMMPRYDEWRSASRTETKVSHIQKRRPALDIDALQDFVAHV